MELRVIVGHKYVFTFHHQADEAARQRRLQLLPSAFPPARTSVHAQMMATSLGHFTWSLGHFTWSFHLATSLGHFTGSLGHFIWPLHFVIFGK